MYKFYLVVCYLTAAVDASKHLPSDIKLCKVDDSDCMAKATEHTLEHFAAGDKDLGFPTIDPLNVEHMHIPAKSTGTIKLNQTYKDLHLHGLSKLKVKSVVPKISDKECTIEVKTNAARLELIGKYEADGLMLGMLQIDGEGPCNVTLENCDMDYVYTCEKYKSGEGKEHIRVTSVDLRLGDPMLHLDFENLVKGNEEQSKKILAMMNDRSKLVFSELKPDYERAYGEIFKELCNNVFSKVPLNELFQH